MELCLGTVQFGMDYGIQNVGRPSLKKALKILEYAFAHGITHFDTAAAYGDAEAVIGTFVRGDPYNRKGIRVISKISSDLLEGVPEERLSDRISEHAGRSIARTGTDSLEGYLLHDPRLLTDEAVGALSKVRDSGLAKAVGVSVYTPEEAMKALEYDALTIIQVPYNVFDQRLNRCVFFTKAKEKGISVYVRSILLQGLATMDHDALPRHMQFAKTYMKRFHEICGRYCMKYLDVAVSYVFSQVEADYAVVGVDTVDQLEEYVGMSDRKLPDQLVNELREAFEFVEERLVNPVLWKKYE